jgi:hypothetical protein
MNSRAAIVIPARISARNGHVGKVAMPVIPM